MQHINKLVNVYAKLTSGEYMVDSELIGLLHHARMAELTLRPFGIMVKPVSLMMIDIQHRTDTMLRARGFDTSIYTNVIMMDEDTTYVGDFCLFDRSEFDGKSIYQHMVDQGEWTVEEAIDQFISTVNTAFDSL